MSEELKPDLPARRGSVGPDSPTPEKRIAARTRELDLIQSLGRLAADARTTDELFRATISVLQQAEDLDLAMVATDVEGTREVACYLARPFEPALLHQLAAHAARVLDWPLDGDAPRIVESALQDFDRSRGIRNTYREQDLVAVPILRRENTVACLLFLPAASVGEAELRLLLSASNHLGVHLDRILTVRETEAQRFREILDSMPQAVFLADSRLRVLLCNQSARKLLHRAGLPPQAGLEQVARRLALTSLIERVRGGGSPIVDGEARVDAGATYSVSISPLSARGRQGRSLVVVLTDVSESRRMQQQLAQSEKMSSLGQMISGTAHELNNPLSSVLGYVQLLRGSAAADEKMIRRLETLQREAERCQKIVRNLLAFARQRDTERMPLSINEVIQSVLGLMGYQLRTSGIDVTVDLDTAIPALHGDRHQLQQVLVNLLNNAQQAVGEADGHGEIHIVTRPVAEGVALDVHDSGPGIPAEIRSRIFDPFFTTKEEGKGTGLGLSIVYGLVSAHGGTIEARQSEKGGACFRIVLPLAAPVTQERSGAATAVAPRCPRPARILVVDDEGALAQMLCEALGRDGHHAVAVGGGREALEQLGRDDYDLIISDVKMPGMDARRLIEELERRRPELVDRVLLTSGDTVSGDPDAFASSRGLELLHKPFDLDELARRVHLRLGAGEDG